MSKLSRVSSTELKCHCDFFVILMNMNYDKFTPVVAFYRGVGWWMATSPGALKTGSGAPFKAIISPPPPDITWVGLGAPTLLSSFLWIFIHHCTGLHRWKVVKDKESEYLWWFFSAQFCPIPMHGQDILYSFPFGKQYSRSNIYWELLIMYSCKFYIKWVNKNIIFVYAIPKRLQMFIFGLWSLSG